MTFASHWSWTACMRHSVTITSVCILQIQMYQICVSSSFNSRTVEQVIVTYATVAYNHHFTYQHDRGRGWRVLAVSCTSYPFSSETSRQQTTNLCNTGNIDYLPISNGQVIKCERLMRKISHFTHRSSEHLFSIFALYEIRCGLRSTTTS